MVSRLPALGHLCRLLTRLPPLETSSSWFPRWYLDIPLACITFPYPVSCDVPIKDPATLPLRYLVSDMLHWDSIFGCLSLKTRAPSRQPTIRLLKTAFFSSTGRNTATLRLVSSINSFVTTGPSGPPLISSFISDTQRIPCLRSWLPSSSHWSVPGTNVKKPILSSKLCSSQHRRYWHADRESITQPRHPPLAYRPHHLLRTSHWSLFWSLDMSPKAFTPWWRLLHGMTGTQSQFHKWNPAQYPSPLCGLCNLVSEELYHFSVGCPFKKSYWEEILLPLHILSTALTMDDIWCVLTSFHRLNVPETLDTDVLGTLGSVFATV